MESTQLQRALLKVAVTGTGWVCVARDRMLGRIPWDAVEDAADSCLERLAVENGVRRLDAILALPRNRPALASVLICHGIGETVEHWRRVQQLLAGSGVASLVFDYTGYGRSAGWFSAEQAERDAVAAFEFLAERTAPLPVAVLGLSLGTGVAGAILGRVAADRLVLCAAFTSIRSAAPRVWIPRVFSFAVQPVWDTKAALGRNTVPVLLVHGVKDGLFPVSMAEELATGCAGPHRLIVHPDVTHNEPFRAPREAYWGPIVEFLTGGTAEKG